jgi:hypothetical protein
MIRSLEIIRPANIPYRLLDFDFFFNTINSHILNIHHLAGMNFIYQQMKMCYLFPQNEFYQLLKLQNTDEPHEAKYNWLVLKGVFGGAPGIAAGLDIENEEILEWLQPDNHFDKSHLHLFRMPERGNDIVIMDEMSVNSFHHFYCVDILQDPQNYFPLLRLHYLNSYTNFYQVINLWFNEENKLEALN